LKERKSSDRNRLPVAGVFDAPGRVLMGWFFFFFLVSGFCSIMYEIIWLRLTMSQFGVTSALVSIVLSMFMAGLGLGSWLSGALIRKYENDIHVPALRLYAISELLIGISAILVPYELHWGRTLLEHTSLSSSWSYYLASGTWVALTIVPWCACMGATIPLAMLAIRRSFSSESQRSFSFLYLANVLGAVAGALLPLLLIELYGFRYSLKIGAVLNFALATSAMAVSLRKEGQVTTTTVPGSYALKPTAHWRLLLLLFATGLTSMGLEIVWIRQYTPYLGTVVYAFATVLAVYLSATFLGSRFYRRWSRTHQHEGRLVWVFLGFSALLPLFFADPEFRVDEAFRLVFGLVPFSALLGFVTPMLVDRWSGGDPDQAGRAYAVNIAGCILGPLITGFLLLPLLGERWVLIVFSLPWLVAGIYSVWMAKAQSPRRNSGRMISAGVAFISLLLVLKTKPYENRFPMHEVLRDNTATVIATGTGRSKLLLVNGVGITFLTPITKMMAHLPLAFLEHPPKNALVVCFGMGTTYRSLMSWEISTTAVELVPSVPRMFAFYHPDGPEIMKSPLSRVVIDDGRRYLERIGKQYDVITIDPPPPVEAAGSSLLYSKEFYSTIKQRLRPGGILQQWLPSGDPVVQASVARALKESFPYVRVYVSLEGWGYHFLASMQALPDRTPEQLVQHMPPRAIHDMMEWGPELTPERQFAKVLGQKRTLEDIIGQQPDAPALQDDRPVNEYYAIRRRLLTP
jgi:spermidine synthase